jgi:translation initiation factor IF-3
MNGREAARSGIGPESVELNREVRLIGAEGDHRGIVSLGEAVRIAGDAGSDLAVVDPRALPPVLKLTNPGKVRYQRARKAVSSRRSRKGRRPKEVKLHLSIGRHDLDTKIRSMRRILEEGARVRVVLVFRGREIHRPEAGSEFMDRIIADLPSAVVESPPELDGSVLSMFLAPGNRSTAEEGG